MLVTSPRNRATEQWPTAAARAIAHDGAELLRDPATQFGIVGGKIGPPPESQSNARDLLVRESDRIAGTIGGACWYSANHHDSGAASAPDRRPQSSGR